MIIIESKYLVNPKLDKDKVVNNIYILSLPFEYEIYTHCEGQASRDFQEEYYTVH